MSLILVTLYIFFSITLSNVFKTRKMCYEDNRKKKNDESNKELQTYNI